MQATCQLIKSHFAAISVYLIFFTILLLKNFFINNNFNYTNEAYFILSLPFFLFFLSLFKLNKYYLAIFLFLPFIYFISYFIKGKFIFTGFNNDIYSWSLVSNHLLNNANIFNILPNGQSYLDSMKVDTIGSYIFNSFFPFVFNKNALDVSSFNIIFVNILVQIGIYNFFKILGCSKNYALIISIFWVINPINIYLSANYFYAQILSYFYFFTFLYLFFRYKDCCLLKRALMVFPVSYLMLVSYQPGFLIFIFAAFVLIAIIQLSLLNQKINVFSSLLKLILFFSILMFINLLFFSNDLIYLYNKLLVLKDTTAGWSLPFLNPFTLIGITTFVPIDSVNIYYKFIYLLCCSLVFVIPFIGYFQKNKLSYKIFNLNQMTIFSINYKFVTIKATILFLLLIFYLCLCFLSKEFENNYKFWKFSTYFFFPLCFCIFYLLLYDFKYFIISFLQKNFGSFIHFFYLVIFVCFIYLSTHLIRYHNSDISHEIKGLNEIINHDDVLLNKIDRLILDLGHWKVTFIALNILSRDFKIYPLGDTYIQKADLSDLTNKDKTNAYIIKIKEKTFVLENISL